MNKRKILGTSLRSPVWQDIEGASVIDYFTNLGFRYLSQLMNMRFFDYLNLNRINNNVAEEMLWCIYRFLYPERARIDWLIDHGQEDQYFDFAAWRKEHPIYKDVLLRDLLFADEINEPALSKIFYWISQAFYKSDEYNWKEYRFLDVREYRQCVKQRKSAE